MALQTSGPISFADIAAEFGMSLPVTLGELAAAAGVAGPPYDIGSFYGMSGALADIDWTALSFDSSYDQAITSAISFDTRDGINIVMNTVTGNIAFFRLPTAWDFTQLTTANRIGSEFGTISGANGSVIINPEGTQIIAADANNTTITKFDLASPYDDTALTTPSAVLSFIVDYFGASGSISVEFPDTNAGSYGLDWGDEGRVFTYLYRGHNADSQAAIITVDCATPYDLPNTPPVSDVKFLRIPTEVLDNVNLTTGFAWSRTGSKAYAGNFSNANVAELTFSTPYDISTLTSTRKITNLTGGSAPAANSNMGFLVSPVSDEVLALDYGVGFTKFTV